MARKDADADDAKAPTTADLRARKPAEAPLQELMGDVVRRIVTRGRTEIEKAATRGRQRLEVRQLQKDRDAFYVRLGKTSYRLVESGEIDHPALRKAMKRIDELEHQLEELKKKGPMPDDAPPEPLEPEES